MTEMVRDVSGDAGQEVQTLRPHLVQFYETDTFLTDAVTEFLAEGLRAEEPGVVIATQPHRELFIERLGAKGIDVGREVAAGRLMLLDA
jgi:hypothetical protein